MKGNLKAPIWIIPVLVLVMAIGAFAAVVALNHSSAGSAEASNLDPSELTQGRVDPEKLAPIVMATSVGTGTASVHPNDPGDASRLKVVFHTSGSDGQSSAAADTSGRLNPGDEIIITVEDDWGFVLVHPMVLSLVTVSSDSVSDNAGLCLGDSGFASGSSFPNETVQATGVNIDFTGDENDLAQMTVTVPDMSSNDNTGTNSICAQAKVTVLFQQGAGFHNAREAGEYDTDVRTTADTTDFEFADGLVSKARLEFSDDDDRRGKKEPLYVMGVEGKESMTIWLDYDGDGKRDSNERDLCNMIADADDTGTCTIILNNPPFFPGTYKASGGSCTLGAMVNCNFVNFVGSEGRTTGYPLALTQADVDRQTMKLLGYSNFSPSTVNVGDTATVTLFDFPASAQIDLIQVLKGLNLTPLDLPTAGTSGEVSFGFKIPGVAPDCIPYGYDTTGTASGSLLNGAVTSTSATTITVDDGTDFAATQIIRINDERMSVTSISSNVLTVVRANKTTTAAAHADNDTVLITSSGDCLTEGDNNPRAGERVPNGKLRVDIKSGTTTSSSTDDSGTISSFNLTIAGANLSISHDTVLANQDLTISGSGFSEGTTNCIFEGQITIGNVPVQIDDASDCPAATLAASDLTTTPTKGILLTTGGTFTITVRVHDVDIAGTTTILNSSLLNEAIHDLRVIDSNGAEGNILVTIAERSLEVTPVSARPRDTVTIVGRSFISDNQDGLSTTVTLKYDCGSTSRSVTADPDVSGNFRETLRIPSGCAIPSTNTLSATISADSKSTGVVETITHDIPEGLITIEPARGASGSLVTIRGEGFRTFETVEKVEFGGLGTLGGRTETTDANGDFVIEGLMIPGLDPGVHAVKVEVSTGTKRTTSSTSFEVVETGLVGEPIPMADVYAMSDSLLRTFWYDNSSKEWLFNDRNPDFADVNDLDSLVSGGVYWILVDDDVTLDVVGSLVPLTCIGDNCWNLITWP